MDEIGNFGSYQPSSPVMESPLMQLANASLSAMRASLSPKEIKNSGVESKGSSFPAFHSISSSVNTYPHISLLSNSDIDSFAQTHVPPEGIVSSMSNQSDKLITKSGSASLIFVGTENPVLENINLPHISKHGNCFPQVAEANLEVTTPESDSQKKHTKYLLPLDDTAGNVTKSSVSRILTSNLSESIFTTSDISTAAAGDAISKKTNNPKDLVSQQTSSQPMLPGFIPLQSQINTTSYQTENVPVKISISKFTTYENEKSIPPRPLESIPETNYSDMQSLQSAPLTQKDIKAFVNPNPISLCTVTKDIHKDTNSSSQINHLSNAGLTPVSNICSLPSKKPSALPVTACSTPTTIVLNSGPLLQLHTTEKNSTTDSLLNEHPPLRESQNISENVTISSEIVSSNTLVNVPTIHTSSVKQIPSFSQMPFQVKSCDYISPCTIEIGTDVSGKKTNLPHTNNSSLNSVSNIYSPTSKQLSKSDQKDIAICSTSVRTVQAKADADIPSKPSLPVTSAKVGYCSSEEINTLAASKSSLAENAVTNLVSDSTVDSVDAFCTPAVITTTPTSASTATCNPDKVTHTPSTSTATFSSSASVASCPCSASACASEIGPHTVAGFLTAATCTPSVAAAPCLPSLTHPTAHTPVLSTHMPLTTPCGASTSMYTSGITTSTLITSSLLTTITSTCIPLTNVQSPEELKAEQDYEIMSNKPHVNDSKDVAKKQPYTCLQDVNPFANDKKGHTGMSHSNGEQSRDIQNADKHRHLLLTPSMEPLLTSTTSSGTDNKAKNTEAPFSIAGTEVPPDIAGSEVPFSVAGTEVPPDIAGSEVPFSIVGTEVPPAIAGTGAPLAIVGTEVPTAIAGTEAPLAIVGTEVPTAIAGTEAPLAIVGTETTPAIDGAEAPPAIDGAELPSSNLNQLLPSASDESFVIVMKPSSVVKASGYKSPIDRLLKNSLSKIEAKMDSSVKQSSSTRITETISNIVSDCMTTVYSSPGRSEPFLDKKSAHSSLIGTVVSVVSDDMKKILTNQNTSNISLELPKKLLKKSKPSEKESKSHSNTSALSNSTLPSAITEEEPVSSDLLNLSSYPPKSTSLLKDILTISSNEKSKSLISTVNTGTVVGTKGSVATKTEGCSISTRPRRTIKARHLFSSSSYSTGSTKSDAAGESAPSSNKQRKRIITQSTDEEKKGTSNCAIKKPHKTPADEETCSPMKKPVARRILPAVKTDSADPSKNNLLIKASPNIAQVPSDTSLPPGYTYLLTTLNLTTAEKDSVKIVKTPIMASNSGVTSTSPTYSNSKRNVTTKCSTIKEQKSSDLTFVETDKTCTDTIISSSRTSISTSDDSLEDANESDTLQNSAEISLRRKRKISTNVNAVSNSRSPKSCEELSQQIAEAGKLIKKEPIEEVDETAIENNAEATSQNSSEVCAPTKVTREIVKLLSAGSSNTQVPLVQDLISPSQGNNLSQTRPPLAPVQLSSPYAIFLPVSLASGATTTVTTPTTSAPLYSIQLNVPNVVRMGKPFQPNDGSMTKKHCTIIPAITYPKTDKSGMKSNLISRNNLIATYYPAPLPESLMNKITVNYHACGECGDTFLFKSSLNAHKTRKCMQLTYNCDNCTMKLVFYNKCSVLEHIRSHYPTRPVTIKLNRMEVMPLPEGITNVLEMEDESESSSRDPEEASKFDCTECGAKFHSARALADHFGHSETVCSFTFYCALCQTYLPRHCAQLAHRRVHHEKPPYVCPECGQLISNLLFFRDHLKYKCMHFSRVAPLACPKCMSKFCYTPELKDHIISVHSETFIKCSICPMAFKASASYQTHHQNTHTSELEQKKEIYKCPLCDTVFHSIQQLMNHVDVHIGELKKDISYAFSCSICFSIFAKRSQLVSHLGSSHHLDYVKHRCKFCDSVCKTAHNLQTHQRAIHNVELKKSELSKSSKMKVESAAAKSKKMKNGDVTHCSLCHIFFATLAQLQMHTMKVHQKKMDDSFPDSGTALSSALVSKNKNSQKFCRYCKAPYKSWSRLMQHILGHRSSGVYICLICTCAAFISKEELSKHEEFCSGENLHDKPPAVHECEACHQLFKQESWLIAHQKNFHPKKGVFTCDVCALPYKSNSSLQKHMQTVHEGKKSFCCYVCKELNKDKIFRCLSLLQKHLMTKHDMSLYQMRMKKSDVEDKNNKSSSIPKEPSDENKQTAQTSADFVSAKKAKLFITKEDNYICAKCNFTGQNFDNFQLHIQEHKTSEDGIQCSTCGLCFAAVDSLRMHHFAVHKIKRSNDSLRDQGVNKSPVPKVLEDSSHSTVFQSSATNTSLTSESTDTVAVESVSKPTELVKLTSDVKSDINSFSCQCNVCCKMFETEHLLKVHMRTHGMAFIRSKCLTMSE